MPEIYRGKFVDVRAELRCDTGSWKSGWNFEGFTLAFNATDKFKQRVWFKHDVEQPQKPISTISDDQVRVMHANISLASSKKWKKNLDITGNPRIA